MTGLGQGLSLLFLLWMMGMFQSGTCNSYADILYGQCYAFCLTRQEVWSQGQATEDYPQEVSEGTIKECRRDQVCKRCLYVCQRPKNQYLDYESCILDCELLKARGKQAAAQQACEEGCNFLQRSTASKHGQCPAPANMTGLAGLCTEQCRRDVECSRMDKCCSNGCGTTCHAPTDINVFPSKPAKLEFKVHRDGGVVVKWGDPLQGDYAKPVVFVCRWWCADVDGVRFLATTRSRMKVKDLRPAVDCNFMVAATNIYGSLGFSDPQPYKKKILKPSPPVKLAVVKNRLKGEKVDVTIKWEPPHFLDGLPLVRYLILWSDGLPKVSPEYHRLRMNKKTVRAERNSAVIPGLKAGTTYFVQVKAVVRWRSRTLNGRPASTYTETDSFPHPPRSDDVERPEEQTLPAGNIYNITVQDAVFIRSQLTAKVTWSVNPNSYVAKYMLYWTPDVCDGEAQHRKARVRSTMEATTHKQEFVLYNLKSNCLYELWLYTVSFYGEKDAGRVQLFQTPPCHDTKGSEGAKCPPKVSPPLPPVNLSVRFKLSASCMCQGVISWDWPPHIKAPHQFSVVWGPSREPLGDSTLGPIVYQTDPFRIHVPGDDNEACVTYLEPRRHYTVQVTSHAHKLKSDPAVKHFATPFNMARCKPLHGDHDFGDETDDISGLEGNGKDPSSSSSQGNSKATEGDASKNDSSGAGHGTTPPLSSAPLLLALLSLLPTAASWLVDQLLNRHQLLLV